MKNLLRLIVILVVFMAVTVRAQNVRSHGIDETERFIFYSVLEGLYEDGVTNDEVDQILMKKEKQSYFHFIYACPICSATIWALEAYRDRPKAFYSLKLESFTFGDGLAKPVHEQLFSTDPHVRLTAINELMKKWIERRMTLMNLSETARAKLVEALEKKRKEGMNYLESYRHQGYGPNFGVAEAAPAYVDLEECAVCNGACGKPMKLPAAKPGNN